MYGDQQRTKTEEKNNFLLSSALIDLGKTGAGEPDGVYLPKMITKVIFIVFTLALGMRPLELVLLFSASSRAILCRLASVSGTEIFWVLHILL